MSAKGMTIPTIFSAVDQMGPTLGKMGREMDKFTSKLENASAFSNKLFSKLTPVLSETTKQLLSYASASAVAFGAIATARFSANAIMEYETAIQSLQAVTGASNEKMKEFKAEIADLGRVSKKNSIEIAGSFEIVGSMMSQYLDDPRGLRKITEAGIMLSKASRMELEPSLQSLTSVMNQFQLKASDASDVVQRLTAGEIVGSLKTGEAAEHLQNFGAVAAGMNVSVAESVALMETLALKLDKSKIGTGARNLLVKISAAGGLDAKAVKDMRAAGVNLEFVMDKTKSLSDRLHELSKIGNDSLKMLSVFGPENITAGQTIFQQLGTYDKFISKINVTNEAQTQAALNTNTLSQAIEQLKNKWINMLTSSSRVGSGLESIKKLTFYLAENLDRIVSVGINVVKFFAAWKVVNLTMGALILANNIRIGIQTALMFTSTTAIASNTTAIAAFNIAERAMAAYIALSTGSLTAFNAALGLSPIFWVVAGVAALAAGLYLLNKREQELVQIYQQKIKLETDKAINEEVAAVKKLTAEYWNLGMGIKDATTASIRFEAVRLANQRRLAEGRASETAGELKNERNKFYLRDLFMPSMFGEKRDIGKRNELAEKYAAEQETIKKLSAQQLGLSQFTQDQIGKGTINAKDVAPIFKESKEKTIYKESIWGGVGQQGGEFRFYIKNDSNNEVDVQSGKTTPKTVMPQTTSTMVPGK